MRRSWLAQATSSRRASKSCSMLAAIVLKESASCAISFAPPVGARAARSPAASRAEASPTRRIERAIERASSSPAHDRGRRRAGGDREDLPVGAHVEHHPARGEHRRERQADREEGQPGELEPDGRRGPERVGDGEPDREARSRRRRGRARSRVEPVADAPDRLEVHGLGRVGSRASRAGAGCGP